MAFAPQHKATYRKPHPSLPVLDCHEKSERNKQTLSSVHTESPNCSAHSPHLAEEMIGSEPTCTGVDVSHNHIPSRTAVSRENPGKSKHSKKLKHAEVSELEWAHVAASNSAATSTSALAKPIWDHTPIGKDSRPPLVWKSVRGKDKLEKPVSPKSKKLRKLSPETSAASRDKVTKVTESPCKLPTSTDDPTASSNIRAVSSKRHALSTEGPTDSRKKPIETSQSTTVSKEKLVPPEDKTENSNKSHASPEASAASGKLHIYHDSTASKGLTSKHHRNSDKSHLNHRSPRHSHRSKQRHQTREELEAGAENSRIDGREPDEELKNNGALQETHPKSKTAALAKTTDVVSRVDAKLTKDKGSDISDQENECLDTSTNMSPGRYGQVDLETLKHKLKAYKGSKRTSKKPKHAHIERDHSVISSKESPSSLHVSKHVKLCAKHGVLHAKKLDSTEPEGYEAISLSSSLADILQGHLDAKGARSHEPLLPVIKRRSPKSSKRRVSESADKCRRHPYALSEEEDTTVAEVVLRTEGEGARSITPRSTRLKELIKQRQTSPSLKSAGLQSLYRTTSPPNNRDLDASIGSTTARLKASLRELKLLSPLLVSGKHIQEPDDVDTSLDESPHQGMLTTARSRQTSPRHIDGVERHGTQKPRRAWVKHGSVPSHLMQGQNRHEKYEESDACTSEMEAKIPPSRSRLGLRSIRRDMSLPSPRMKIGQQANTKRQNNQHKLSAGCSVSSDQEISYGGRLLESGRGSRKAPKNSPTSVHGVSQLRRHGSDSQLEIWADQSSADTHFGGSDLRLIGTRRNPTTASPRRAQRHRSTSRGSDRSYRARARAETVVYADALNPIESVENSKTTEGKEIHLSLRPALCSGPMPSFSPKGVNPLAAMRAKTPPRKVKNSRQISGEPGLASTTLVEEFDKLLPVSEEPAFEDKVTSIKHWLETTSISRLSTQGSEARFQVGQATHSAISFKAERASMSMEILHPTPTQTDTAAPANARNGSPVGDNSRRRYVRRASLPRSFEPLTPGSKTVEAQRNSRWPMTEKISTKPTEVRRRVSPTNERGSPKKVAALAAAGHKAYQRKASRNSPGFKHHVNVARRMGTCTRFLLGFCVLLVIFELVAVSVAFLWHKEVLPDIFNVWVGPLVELNQPMLGTNETLPNAEDALNETNTTQNITQNITESPPEEVVIEEIPATTSWF